MALKEWKPLASFDTELNADTVEWCPHNPNIFVCGTYQLIETDNNRIGRLYLFSFNPELNKLDLLQRIDTPAILDCKWFSDLRKEKSLLAVATAHPLIQIYEFQTELVLIKTLEFSATPTTLALSLDWFTNSNLIVSDSTGTISIFNDFELTQNLKCHDFEAWICATNPWNLNQVVTGGDDSLLKIYDLRSYGNCLVNKVHEAGVTSAKFHSEFTFVSGSYDENVRFWDSRNLKSPLSVTKMSGGVWRLKFDPIKSNYLLAACMYGSFQILDITKQVPVLVGDYLEHKTICYGSDWSYNQGDNFIATCSFYDHLLTVSTIDLG